ncbi:thioesterase family protein [Ruminiclostridium papyrosolvens]|uniref:Thioesterase n=1 Tax=Ruminiclostridium papyrosolvens C7 TaxID=1330534 RepID=U4R6H3_9FIRM|nr:thioesterase family protein [Ruminiclostridium papyrosolvens]EPR14372.1 thioesterase [Ruminiclostridium papyrosolvens C7]
MELEVGITGSAQVLVSEANTAKTMGSGSLDVFATPAMIALMEKAASLAVQNYIDEDSSTVGTMINIKHIAATPVGMNVTARAELAEIDGKRLVFTVEAFDGKAKIGEGQHERFIINAQKFIARANSKLNE